MVKFKKGELVRHVNSNRLYRVLLTPANELRIEATNEVAYMYAPYPVKPGSIETLWVRAASEMEDGRFVKEPRR